MTIAYPPADCSYRVDHAGDKRWFADEHELIAWFALREKALEFDPVRADEDYKIFCETPDAEPIGISYLHPRLVHARLWGRKEPELGTRSTPGTTRPPSR